jgi:hypothetical protein
MGKNEKKKQLYFLNPHIIGSGFNGNCDCTEHVSIALCSSSPQYEQFRLLSSKYGFHFHFAFFFLISN